MLSGLPFSSLGWWPCATGIVPLGQPGSGVTCGFSQLEATSDPTATPVPQVSCLTPPRPGKFQFPGSPPLHPGTEASRWKSVLPLRGENNVYLLAQGQCFHSPRCSQTFFRGRQGSQLSLQLLAQTPLLQDSLSPGPRVSPGPTALNTLSRLPSTNDTMAILHTHG